MASQMWRTHERRNHRGGGSVAERPQGATSAVAAARLSRQPNLADNEERPIGEYASTLQAHFDGVAGDDGELDLGELTQVLKTSEASKSPTETFRDDGFARLLFRMIDADGSGLVSRDEYVDTMVRLRFGTTEQRLHLLFCLYDEDGCGYIDHGELTKIVAEQVSASKLKLDTSQIAQIVDAIFADADDDHSGEIDVEEFLECAAQPRARGEHRREGAAGAAR